LTKIAVIADADVATYFRSAGVKMCYSVKESKEAGDLMLKLAENKDIAVIVTTERIAEDIKTVIDEVSKRVYPTVLTVPGKEGPIPGKVSPIMSLVKRTVGVDIKI